MAVIGRNYNRIIELTLTATNGRKHHIACPKHGRKPVIEITGNYTTANFLPAFNVTVKNLYLELKDQNYSKLKVKAGYADGSSDTFEGSILSLYQESPGPEGQTVIQCQLGQVQTWLDETVQMNYEPGTMLTILLEDIRKALRSTGVRTGQLKARYLQTKERFEYDGPARGAIAKLQKTFEDAGLNVFVRNNYLCALCAPGNDFISAHKLEYLSAPPQENVGGQEGAYYTTVSAPWNPELRIGDQLRIPSKVYVRNLVKVGGLSKTQVIQVTAISFHFSTTGSANSMTVQGFNVGGVK